MHLGFRWAVLPLASNTRYWWRCPTAPDLPDRASRCGHIRYKSRVGGRSHLVVNRLETDEKNDKAVQVLHAGEGAEFSSYRRRRTESGLQLGRL